MEVMEGRLLNFLDCNFWLRRKILSPDANFKCNFNIPTTRSFQNNNGNLLAIGRMVVQVKAFRKVRLCMVRRTKVYLRIFQALFDTTDIKCKLQN